MQQTKISQFINIGGIMMVLCLTAFGQDVVRDLKISAGGTVEIVNHYGRVTAKAIPSANEGEIVTGKMTAVSERGLSDNELKIMTGNGKTIIVVSPSDQKKRVDLAVELPERASVKIETTTGAVDILGDLTKVEVSTDTGTIATDIPDEDLTYHFLWTESRPRYKRVPDRSAGTTQALRRPGFEAAPR